LNTTKLGESGIVIKVVDGDTFDVEGIGRIRLADVNTPEMDSKEGREAKEYVKGLCYHKKVYLDIDDLYVTGKYGRMIAVVYVPYNETHYVNLNQLLLQEGYAEARDYRNEFDPDDWMGPLEYVAITSSPVRSPLPIPGFEFWLAMSGVVAATCLSRRKR
jgi:endonuclease YncB( thermonuclease family)